MHRLVLHDCHRRCLTIGILQKLRAASGMGLGEAYDIINELYYGTGRVVVDLPVDVDLDSLAAEVRSCRTEVDVISA